MYTYLDHETVAGVMNFIKDNTSRTYNVVRKMKQERIQALTLKTMIDGVRINKGTSPASRVQSGTTKPCSCILESEKLIKAYNAKVILYKEYRNKKMVAMNKYMGKMGKAEAMRWLNVPENKKKLPETVLKPQKPEGIKNYCHKQCPKLQNHTECVIGGKCKAKMELVPKSKNKYVLVGCQNMVMQHHAAKAVRVTTNPKVQPLNELDRPDVCIRPFRTLYENDHIMDFGGVLQEVSMFKNFAANTQLDLRYIKVNEYSDKPIIINATLLGSEMSFLKPSVCNPNCAQRVWLVNDKYRVSIVVNKQKGIINEFPHRRLGKMSFLWNGYKVDYNNASHRLFDTNPETGEGMTKVYGLPINICAHLHPRIDNGPNVISDTIGRVVIVMDHYAKFVYNHKTIVLTEDIFQSCRAGMALTL